MRLIKPCPLFQGLKKKPSVAHGLIKKHPRLNEESLSVKPKTILIKILFKTFTENVQRLRHMEIFNLLFPAGEITAKQILFFIY